MSGRSAAVRAALLGVVALLSACSGQQGRIARFARLPDWNGYWVSATNQVGISGYSPDGLKGWTLQLMGTGAPWNESTAAQLKADLARMQAAEALRKSSGWGYPMMMELVPPTQFLVTPEETLILNSYRDVRHVYTDGRPHPPEEDRWPTPWGDSIGHWEGDTLVIDTVSVQQPNVIMSIAFPPLSEQAHYVERLHKTGPDTMELEMTVEDPTTLAQPWVTKLAYQRAAGLDRMIHGAFDNDRSVAAGDTLTIAPPAN